MSHEAGPGAPEHARITRRQLLVGSASLAATSSFLVPPDASAQTTGASRTASELWRWTATDLAAAIRRGQVSSREATTSVLARIASVNPKVNGVVAFRNNIAAEDSSAARNLRLAGAVIVGRTNCPAFAFRWFTDNDLYGRTANPWRRSITPGGSSGGAAAAVAVGMGPFAHGTDIAGSVRYPSYCCGVPGIRLDRTHAAPGPCRLLGGAGPARAERARLERLLERHPILVLPNSWARPLPTVQACP